MAYTIHQGDVLEVLRGMADEKFTSCVTSPPYWGLRDYGTGTWEGGDEGCDHKTSWGGNTKGKHDNTPNAVQKGHCGKCGARRVDQQLGLEATPEEYIERMVEVFREVRRVLRSDGTCWVNMGDCYATGAGKVGEHPGGGEQGERWKGNRGVRGGSPKHSAGAMGPMTQPNRMPQAGLKPKDLMGMPWRLAFALQADGWWLRSAPPWFKDSAMPESAQDRPTTAHEFLFLLTKSAQCYYDGEAVRVPFAGASISRMAQDVASQDGSMRANAGGKTNGPLRAVGDVSAGRSRRTSDWAKEMLLAQAEELESRARELRGWAGGDHHGLLTDSEGEPLAFFVNPQGFDMERCTKCKRTYEGRDFKKLPKRMVEEDGKEKRKVRCQCGSEEHWLSHFATFPPGLVTPCLRASCSEKGACPSCGAAWRRVVVKGLVNEAQAKRCGCTAFGGYGGTATKQFGRAGAQNASEVKARVGQGLRDRHTVAWEPGCKCGCEDTVPCTVLDPFGGSGTTALVAEKLGLDCTLIELNPEYVAIAEARLHKAFGEQRRLAV